MEGDRAAMRFASARYLPREGMLDVTFENGDHLLVAAESILPPATLAASPDWATLRIGETGDVLELPAEDRVIEIPWDRIRSLVDPKFRAVVAEQAEERARRIGRRVRALRIEAGLTRRGLADKAGVSRTVIADLEAGKTEPRNDLIEGIAIALGCRLRDFAEETPSRERPPVPPRTASPTTDGRE